MKPHIPWRPRPLRSKKKQQKLTEAQKLVKVQLQQLRLEQKRLQVEQENFNACMAFILSLQFCALLLCLSVGLRLFMFQSRRSNVCVRFCTFLVCSLLWLLIKIVSCSHFNELEFVCSTWYVKSAAQSKRLCYCQHCFCHCSALVK